MSQASAVQAVEFAVLGNAPEVLDWLERLLSGSERDGEVTGAVVHSLEPEAAPASADRIAVVLDDPVRLLAADRPVAPSGYSRAISAILEGSRGSMLVFAADELAGSPERLAELLEHLGRPSASPTELPPPTAKPLTASRRAVLFATIRDDVEDLERITGRTFRSWRFGEDPDVETVATDLDGVSHEAERSFTTAPSLFYFGRGRDVSVPAGAIGLSDWDVLPARVAALLADARRLTVLDAMSFPFDALRNSDRDIPLAVNLPDGFDEETLGAVLDAPVLRDLTPFDRISGPPGVLAGLQAANGWPSSMLVSESELISDRAWGDALSPTAREDKADYRILRRALSRQLVGACEAIPSGERPSVMVVGDGITRWCPLALGMQAELTGIDFDRDSAGAVADEFPGARIANVLPSEDQAESSHVVMIIDGLCRLTAAERQERLATMLQALRVGGRLIVLDHFLDGRVGALIGAPNPRALLDDLLDASARHVVLEHIEALTLHRHDLASVGVFSFTKLGRPVRA